MSFDTRTLSSVYWQPRLQELGEIVEEHQDIHQCLMTIIRTHARSDPHRPEFGVGIMDYVDKPLNVVRPRLVREILRQVQRWEARANVTGVSVTANDAGTGLKISIRWTPSGRDNTAGPVSVSVIDGATGTLTFEG